MPHSNIIFQHCLFFLRLVLYFELRHLWLKYLLPPRFELISGHNFILIYPHIHEEHGWIPLSKFDINFAEFPFPTAFVVLREVKRYDIEKVSTDFLEFCSKVITVKLEGAIHDSTVIKSSNYKRWLPHWLLWSTRTHLSNTIFIIFNIFSG